MLCIRILSVCGGGGINLSCKWSLCQEAQAVCMVKGKVLTIGTNLSAGEVLQLLSNERFCTAVDV